MNKKSTLQSLTGSLQGRITYREIPVVITGNRYAEYNFCWFWLHNFPVLITLNLVLQGLKGCFDTLYSLQGQYRVELTYREIPVVITGNRYAEYNFWPFWLHNFPALITLKL